MAILGLAQIPWRRILGQRRQAAAGRGVEQPFAQRSGARQVFSGEHFFQIQRFTQSTVGKAATQARCLLADAANAFNPQYTVFEFGVDAVKAPSGLAALVRQIADCKAFTGLDRLDLRQ